MELIDKKSFISAIKSITDEEYSKKPNMKEVLETFIDIVEMFPKTDGLVHAKWIGEEYTDNDSVYQECSNCHRVRFIDKYCSNCGAKMDCEED